MKHSLAGTAPAVHPDFPDAPAYEGLCECKWRSQVFLDQRAARAATLSHVVRAVGEAAHGQPRNRARA